MPLSGISMIGFRSGSATGPAFRARNPKTGTELEPDFFSATVEDVDRAALLAEEAFRIYGWSSGREKACFLRQIATNIESIREEVVGRAELETALPQKRLESEMARTCGQLRFFAELVEEGSWVLARIDRADPERQPTAKPDIRSLLRPLGAIVVFGASNFPLAFSVAGGDTASALAAGNPVIVKGHPAHPGTSELVGSAIREAVHRQNLPEGVFSLLFDRGNEVGTRVLKHPAIRGAGFTGSQKAGKTLMQVASSRREPIPFYAEMGSTNPVFILPGALRQSGEKIAAGLYRSFTVGAGQFCTKPGMVFLPDGAEATDLRNRLQELVNDSPRFHLLTEAIRSSYGAGIEARKTKPSVKLVAVQDAQAPDITVQAALFETDAASFLQDPELAAEIFGPSTVLVHHSGPDEILEIARNLEGHLTATIHGTEQDIAEAGELIRILERKVGRLIFNGFPTGVEVCHAMVHGGPFPATSDGRSTSVGTQAIYRFTRPVCYQGFTNAALPEELKDENPLGIWRLVDGEMTREPLARPAPGKLAG